MKIMALSKEFFINRWNVFDLVIVLASLLDLGLEIGSGLSVLRGMRLVSCLFLPSYEMVCIYACTFPVECVYMCVCVCVCVCVCAYVYI